MNNSNMEQLPFGMSPGGPASVGDVDVGSFAVPTPGGRMIIVGGGGGGHHEMSAKAAAFASMNADAGRHSLHEHMPSSSASMFASPLSNVPQTPLSALYAQPPPSIAPVVPATPGGVGGPDSVVSIPVPQLQNIVSTVNLGCKLDLKNIALHARNAEYNPKRFAAVIMRIREPRTTALIFGSGKMVCTGAKSEEQSRLAARKYARIVQKLGFNAKFLDFKIQNMVGSCDVRFAIQLESLCLAHTQFATYEPELFPGLIYRMVKPRVVLLIFVSGKVVITGAKVKQEIDDAFSSIYPILKGFRKQ